MPGLHHPQGTTSSIMIIALDYYCCYHYYFYHCRCLFEVQRFVSENQLAFVGATWYTSTSDAYVAYLGAYENACALIPGFSDPCPGENGKTYVAQNFCFFLFCSVLFCFCFCFCFCFVLFCFWFVFVSSKCNIMHAIIQVMSKPRNLKGVIGSLFDPCINAMGRRPY